MKNWKAEKYRWLKMILEKPRSVFLPATAKVASGFAVHFADSNTGIAFPSVRKIGDRSGLGDRQVSRAIRQLRLTGFLVVLERRGRHRSSIYQLRFPEDPAVTSSDERRMIAFVERRKSKTPTPVERGGSLTARPNPAEAGTRAYRAVEGMPFGDDDVLRARHLPESHISRPDHIEAWNGWRSDKGLPPLSERIHGITTVCGKPAFRTPFERPPTNARDERIAFEHERRLLAWEG